MFDLVVTMSTDHDIVTTIREIYMSKYDTLGTMGHTLKLELAGCVRDETVGSTFHTG